MSTNSFFSKGTCARKGERGTRSAGGRPILLTRGVFVVAGGGLFVGEVCHGTSNTPLNWYNEGEGGGE